MSSRARTVEPPRLDLVNQCLWRGEQAIHLTPRAFAVLCYLADRPNRLVTKDELLSRIWAGTVVTDGVLKVCVREIRKALDDDSKAPTWIETAHRRGYRLIRELQRLDPPEVISSAGAVRGANEAAPEPFDRGTTALVGRREVLAELHSALDRALAGARQLVFLSGPPGIGKTSVVDTFVHEASARHSLLVARGQCIEHYGAGEAYLPLLEALSRLAKGRPRERVLAWLARCAPTWLAAIGPLAPEVDRRRLERETLGATPERMLREMSEALEALSDEVPVLIVLEDLHWSDFSSLDLIALLGRRRERARLILVGTFRTAFAQDHPLRKVVHELAAHRMCEELELGNLSEPDVAEFLDSRYAGNAFPGEMAHTIHQRTEGNPLFMVHAVDFLTARNLIQRKGSTWRLEGDLSALENEVPASIRQVIEMQIERLAKEERELLEVASAAGLEFSAAACAAALGQDLLAVEEHCDRLAGRRQFLRTSGLGEFPDGSVSARYVFLHSLHASVLYQSIAPARRSRLHASIARRGEELYGEQTPEIAAELALHFENGLDLSRAVHYLRLAAEKDSRRHANREALAHLDHAALLAERLSEPERALRALEVAESIGLLRRSMGDMQGAANVFEALARRAGDTVGPTADVRAIRVRSLLYLASALFWLDHARCLSAADRAVELAEELGDGLLLAHARGYRAHWSLNLEGFRAEHVRACAEAVSAARASRDQRLLGLHVVRFAYAQCLMSRYAEAVDTSAEGLELAVASGDAFDFLLCQFFRAWALLHSGRFGEMQRTLDEALAMAEKNGHRPWAALFKLEIAQLALEGLDFERARQLAAPVLEEARGSDMPTGQIFFHAAIVLGAAHAAAGDVPAARRCVEELRRSLAERRTQLDVILELPRRLLEARIRVAADPDGARQRALELCELAEGCGEITYAALAHTVLSELDASAGKGAEARAQLAEALSALARGDAPLAAWRVHSAAARAAERNGSAREMQKHRSAARTVVERLAASFGPRSSEGERFLARAAL